MKGVYAGLLCALIFPLTPAPEPTQSSGGPIRPRATAAAHWKDVYRSLPLSFEPNQGQTDGRVKFLSRGAGYALFLTADEAFLALQKESQQKNQRSVVKSQESEAKNEALETPKETANSRSPLATCHSSLATAFLRMKLVGADPKAQVTGVQELPGKSNYFVGNDPMKWRSAIPNYAGVRYHGVYPGVDLVYYGNQGQLEYDFVVAPGADPNSIRLAIDGAEKLRVDPKGDLAAQVGVFKVRLRRPFIYQPGTGSDYSAANARPTGSQSIDGRFVLRGKHEVRFDIAPFDRTRPLIIDPGLSYSTYLGGMASDQGTGIAVGPDGTLYVTGTTTSSNFPNTPFVFQSMLNGTSNAFVAKINAMQSGSASLVYSTFLGGAGIDSGSAIAVDASGSAYITGQTASPDFPVTPATAFQAGPQGSTDAFMTKLSPTGTSLPYSTYLGGSGADAGLGIAVDNAGMAYVTGQTASSDFPTTANGFRRTAGGANDVFVAKIDTNQSGAASLAYSTYLGGSGDDMGNGIAADAMGNAYVTGSTASTNFPVTPATAFQNALGGSADAFVTRIDTTKSAAASLVYSTYLGGNNSDAGFGIAVGGPGIAYVTGQTTSPFPIKPGAFQGTPGGGFDIFVSKLDTTTSGAASLVYSSYLGGSGNDVGRGIAVDGVGNAYVSGTTFSSDFPVASPVQASFAGGNSDAVVAKVNPAGSVLIFSTYLGGTGDDAAQGIAVDTTGSTSVIGQTTSTDFPTQQAFQTSNNGTAVAFVTRLGDLTLPVARFVSTSLSFITQLVGTTSPAMNLTLTNVGDGPLIVTAPISFSGTNPSDFALNASGGTTCLANTTVPAGSSCNISVTFTPSGAGSRTATMAVTDNAPGSPQMIGLSGTGTSNPGPVVSLNPASLAFSGVVVGATSAAKTVTLTNIGAGILHISSITLGGLNPGDFAIAGDTTCAVGTPVAGGASCAINVTFAPATSGSRVAAISIADDATGSPHLIPLSGVNADFGISAGSATATVSAGSSATYTITITPTGGLSQDVSLSCTDPATASACSISPASVTPSGSTALTATVTVTTTARSASAPRGGPLTLPPAHWPLSPWWLRLSAFTALAALARRAGARRRAWLGMAVIALSLLFWATCGGGSSAPQGTPQGSYALTFTGTTATTQALTHTVSVTLTVN